MTTPPDTLIPTLLIFGFIALVVLFAVLLVRRHNAGWDAMDDAVARHMAAMNAQLRRLSQEAEATSRRATPAKLEQEKKQPRG